MKKPFCILCAFALLFSLSFSASAQESTWDAKKNATVDSITSQYKEKYIATGPTLTTADIFPALGQYESTTNPESSTVSIRIDPDNKGLVWVEGLPQGKIKAMLRKSPATYKIPVQKTEDGKDVAEGTLIFDNETNTLSIAIGKKFNAADPSTAFMPVAEEELPASTSKKIKKTTVAKAWMYTGTKIIEEKETVKN